jgi:hypothetical protein
MKRSWLLLIPMLLAACEPEDDEGTPSDPTGAGGGGHGGGMETGGMDPGAGGGGEGGGGQGGGEPTEPSWGEPDPGVTVGPFGEFKAFRSGCGEQIWGRWIPRSDFALGVQTIHLPGGGSNQTTYFDTPVFLEDEKTVFLFSDAGGYGEGEYQFDLKVGNPDDSVLTHIITAPAEPLFKWPGQIELVNAFTNGSGHVQLQITPAISGNIGRAFAYDAAECKAGGTVYLEPITIHEGVTTEVDLMMQLTGGEAHTIVLQGVDDARDYLYYATLELTL